MARSTNSHQSADTDYQSEATRYESQKNSYQAGSLILAIAFLINGLIGLTQSRTAKLDFHRCHYIVSETLFFGDDFSPSRETLDQNFVLFGFIYHLQKVGMVVLSFMIV